MLRKKKMSFIVAKSLFRMTLSGQQYQQSDQFPEAASKDDALTLLAYIHDDVNCAEKPGSSKSFGNIWTSRVNCEDMSLPVLPYAESSDECGHRVQEETLCSEMNSKTSTSIKGFALTSIKGFQKSHAKLTKLREVKVNLVHFCLIKLFFGNLNSVLVFR